VAGTKHSTNDVTSAEAYMIVLSQMDVEDRMIVEDLVTSVRQERAMTEEVIAEAWIVEAEAGHAAGVGHVAAARVLAGAESMISVQDQNARREQDLA
jgi:hypothetical protein